MTETFADFHYQADDGLSLHARVYGSRTNHTLPVICLPGLTRNARDFHELAIFLSAMMQAPRQVVAFDYRGRGGSQYDLDWKNYHVAVEARDIISGLTALAVDKADFIGTSRGGLIIHLLAAMRPELLGNVVLNDIGPVIEPAGLQQIRFYLGNWHDPVDLDDAIRHQRAVHGGSFSHLFDEDWLRMAKAVYRFENGRPIADYDPALINTLTALDLTVPLPSLWPQFDLLCGKRLLLIRGENTRLLSPQTVDEMRARHPDMSLITVTGQGHPPMLETANLPKIIGSFLEGGAH